MSLAATIKAQLEEHGAEYWSILYWELHRFTRLFPEYWADLDTLTAQLDGQLIH